MNKYRAEFVETDLIEMEDVINDRGHDDSARRLWAWTAEIYTHTLHII